MKKKDFLNKVSEVCDNEGINYSLATMPNAMYINYMASEDETVDAVVDWLIYNFDLENDGVQKTLNICDIIPSQVPNKQLYVIDLGWNDVNTHEYVKMYYYERFYTQEEFNILKSKMDRITKGDYEPYE